MHFIFIHTLAGVLAVSPVNPIQDVTSKLVVENQKVQFTGTWEGSLQCNNGHKFIDGEGATLKFRIVIRSDHEAAVFEFNDGKWQELKPGAFNSKRLGPQMIINSLTSGQDADGTWFEGSSFTLAHRNAKTLVAYWLRTVNNINLPPSDISYQYAWGCSGEMNYVQSKE